MPAPNLDLAPVRAAIKATLEGVEGMGVVHDHEPFAGNASAMATMYRTDAQSGNRLYGWFVSLRSMPEFYLDIGRWIADPVWRLVAYMSLDEADGTEKKLAAQLDLVRNAFRDADDLGLGDGYTLIVPENGNKRGVQLEEMDHVMFAGVLCHRLRCSLTTRIYF